MHCMRERMPTGNEATMMKVLLALTAAFCAFGCAGVALAQDEAPPVSPDPSQVTMRIIEDPEAMSAEVITRRIVLPLPPAAEDDAPGGAAEGRGTADAARTQGRDQGQEAAERGREVADEARERREDFGRARADEVRRDPPRPEPPSPPRP
jgi:hypothetical protein